MSYTKTTDFAAKDALPSGNPSKIVKGTEIDNEFDAIQVSDAANLKRDGTAAATANIPMGNFKFTSVGNGSARSDSINLGQAQDSAYTYIGSISGVDTITGSLTPALVAYAAGQRFEFVSAGANTGAVTININGLGAKSITKLGTTALAAGDIPSGALVQIVYDGTRFQLTNLAAQTVATLDAGVTTTTQALYDNSTKIATTAYADRAVRGVIQSISASVGSNALTISASALTLDFRSTTLGSGTVTTVSGTPANLVISSGSTLGTVNGIRSQIVVLAINNAGTIELAAVNIAGGTDLTETELISTTAEGGAGGADSATVIYSTTARTNVAYRVIGIIRSTQATAGTWATAPSLIQGAGGNALTAMSSLGYGQTWQDVTSSRAFGTTYYNTTGKPIEVAVAVTRTNDVARVDATVNGVALPANYTGSASAEMRARTSFTVPPGQSYVVTSGAGTIQRWCELR